jgi:hypothetical protein
LTSAISSYKHNEKNASEQSAHIQEQRSSLVPNATMAEFQIHDEALTSLKDKVVLITGIYLLPHTHSTFIPKFHRPTI